MRGPLIARRAGHIYNSEVRVDYAGLLRNLPAIHRPAQVNHSGAVFGLALQQGHRLFTCLAGNSFLECTKCT